MPRVRLFAAALCLAACEDSLSQAPGGGGELPVPGATAPGKEGETPPAEPEEAPRPTARLETDGRAKDFSEKIEGYFAGHPGRRIYIQLDKPLYQPGETIWVKSWDLAARTLDGNNMSQMHTYELVNPKGSVVLTKLVKADRGLATNDLEIPEGVEGGEYRLRIQALGHSSERPLIVSTYEAPRLKKKLEWVRKAYGPGDEVTATIQVKRPTGEPLAGHPLTGQIMLDGEALAPVSARTNAEGGALVRFTLPGKIERGDGLLTVLVEDGGITESVSKRIPIVLKKLQLAFYPEGGELVTGLPSRLYLEAKNTLGKPADVAGEIVDDRGNTVARFETFHDGLGRLELTPSTGRSYSVSITKPEGISERYPLPLAKEEGCVLRTFDDFEGQLGAIRAAVRCSSAREVTVVAMLRENLLDAATVRVTEKAPAVVYLEAKDPALRGAQGAARVTVLDEAMNPLAERLVFRNRRGGLKIALEADQKSYTPREQVALTVRTTTFDGKPVAGEVALSVVDDTVLSFADDKTGHMLTRLFLEPEVPGEIEEPNFYFDLTKEKSARAMDLLLGTRGWRRFEWQAVNAPPEPPPEASVAYAPMPMDFAAEAEEDAAPRGQRANRPMPARPAAPPAPPRAPAGPPPVAQPRAEPKPVMRAEAPAKVAEAKKKRVLDDDRMVMAREARRDRQVGGGAMAQRERGSPLQFAPVRVFPAPSYTEAHSGPRSDFRETIFWAPRVKTDKNGKAIVTFYLSDAVTSFRATAEAVGGGAAGRSEQVVKSSLPFSLAVKLPTEVSAGDRLLLPLTLSNEVTRPLPIELTAELGELVSLESEVALAEPTLAAGKRESLFYPVRVTGTQGKTKVRFAAEADGLADELERTLTVVPLGFPIELAASGTLRKTARHELDLGDALPGSITAQVTLYPSPIATLLTGIDGMIREPYGCFEQTSSSNYPNVMIMNYLRSTDGADPELIERVRGVLDRGYQRLVGFETQEKGYEWFGRQPAHEALTAYGVAEFVDMRAVYGGVDEKMIGRTVAWLKGRRDGKGSFTRSSTALDSFGRAAPHITDAYIVYAMTKAGFSDLQPELEIQARHAQSGTDPYLVALATNSLLQVPAKRSLGLAAAKRLAGMQKDDGRWAGAEHSITRSTGPNLDVETTSFAILALSKTGEHSSAVRSGVEWLMKQRSGHGAFGATQATVLALEALTTYALDSRKMQASGSVVVKVNGQDARTLSYAAGQKDPLRFEELGKYLRPGKNVVELVTTGDAELPYSVGVELRSLKPANHPQVVVGLETKIERTKLKMGENVRVTATVRNVTAEGQPMTLARVGLPGGLTFQTWQLKELVEKGTIAFYETRAREVILYFRDLAPEAVKEVPLDLVATVPGRYTGPASSAYLYYTSDRTDWPDPRAGDIAP